MNPVIITDYDEALGKTGDRLVLRERIESIGGLSNRGRGDCRFLSLPGLDDLARPGEVGAQRRERVRRAWRSLGRQASKF